MTRTYALASAGLIGTLILGAVIATVLNLGPSPEARFADCRGGAVAGDIGGPFTLVSETGETVTAADVLTEPSLIYFGYTFCPDVCPLDAVRNAEAVDLLQAQGRAAQPVFVTVDPERDTPDVLDAFTAHIHEDMLGLTGTPAQVADAASAYRVYYRSHKAGDDPYYLVDHTAFTYLVLPEYGFVDFFRRETSPADMAERAACFMDAAG